MSVDLRHGPELAERAARDLENAGAEDIHVWVAETFGARFAVASSMQDGVLPHLVSGAAPDADVLLLGTGYRFAETIGTRGAIASTYRLNVLILTPRETGGFLVIDPPSGATLAAGLVGNPLDHA